MAYVISGSIEDPLKVNSKSTTSIKTDMKSKNLYKLIFYEKKKINYELIASINYFFKSCMEDQ